MAAPVAFEQPTINSSWQAFLQHLPVILVVYVGTIVFSALSMAAYLVIVMFTAAATGGDSDTAVSLAALIGQLVQMPFSLLSSLLSVLLVAVPALYYERGEVVTIVGPREP